MIRNKKSKLLTIYVIYISQLPTPTWAADDEEAEKQIQWFKDRGLPVPIGGNFNGVSLKRRIAKW